MPTRPKSTQIKQRNKAQQTSSQSTMGMFIVLHGVPNIGKSSFAAAFPDVFYLYDRGERGIKRLMDAGEVDLDAKYVRRIETWSAGIEALQTIPKGRQTVVIDAATGWQQLAYEHVATSDFKGNMSAKDGGFFSYQKGPKRVATNEWPRDMISSIVDLTDRGIHVILIAHSRSKVMTNPHGEDFEKFVPYMDNDVWMATVKDAQYVIFMGHEPEVHGKKASEDNYQARLYVKPSPRYESKSLPRLNTPSISMGACGYDAAQNFMQAIGRSL